MRLELKRFRDPLKLQEKIKREEKKRQKEIAVNARMDEIKLLLNKECIDNDVLRHIVKSNMDKKDESLLRMYLIEINDIKDLNELNFTNVRSGIDRIIESEAKYAFDPDATRKSKYNLFTDDLIRRTLKENFEPTDRITARQIYNIITDEQRKARIQDNINRINEKERLGIKFVRLACMFIGHSVTRRIDEIAQPYGGYIKPKSFSIEHLGGTELDTASENVHPTLIGLAVDYMTRYMVSESKEEAFKISLLGSGCVHEKDRALNLLNNIIGLDDKSVCSVIKLVGYDVCVRAGADAYTDIDEINPDINTINNVRTMVERSINFFNKYGPIVKHGFTFEGGYTCLVGSGDGDYLTRDTLWDFKVSKKNLDSKQTLQLLMYWRLGLHSIHPEFKEIQYLGIYNPRKDIVYRLNVNEIPEEVVRKVDTDIIGYGKFDMK